MRGDFIGGIRRRVGSVVLGCAMLLAAGLVTPATTTAQGPTLSLRDVVRIGLEWNQRGTIAEIDREQAENSVSLGAAGYLPTFDAYAGYNGSLTSTSQEYLSGEIVERNGAGASGYSAGVDLNWNLFRGFGSAAEMDRLEGVRDRAVNAESVEQEGLVVDIAEAYFEVARHERLMAVEQEALRLSQARRDLAQLRVETGAGIRFDLTTTMVDLASDSAALLRRELLLTDARIRLNRLMNRPPQDPINVEDRIAVERPMPELESLRERAERENRAVRAAVIEGEIAAATRRLAASERYPSLSLNVGYDYTRSESEAGFVTSNRTNGLNYNLTASINLFNGLVTNQRIENAELDIERSEVRRDQAVADADALLTRLYEQYQRQEELLAFERRTIEGARENLQLARDRVELGAVTPIEIRQAQASFVEAESRLVEAEYSTALLALSIWQVTGDVMFIAE